MAKVYNILGGSSAGVESVEGIGVDNTDPLNPIVNIPEKTSDLINDGENGSNKYLTQQSVLQYPTFNDFPITGQSDTIYIALDTDLAYSWDGNIYTAITTPFTGITGLGTVNTVPKFTAPSVLGNSRFTDNGSNGRYGSGTSYVEFVNGNTFLRLNRAQSNMVFMLGNPGVFQENSIISDNTFGTSFTTKGYLSFKTGAAANTEGLKLLPTGQIQLPQVPDAGNTSDSILARDTSGNLKQLPYPIVSGGIEHAITTGTDVYTATISGITSYADGDAYLIRFTNGNTTESTLNINSLGAVPLYRNNDGPLLGGDITSGGEMLCVYNLASNIFQVIGISPNSLYAYVTNDDSITITKGMPVYAFSGTGDRMTVKRAFNTGDATSAQTVGLVLSTSIAAGQKGIIMMQGLLDGLSILPTSTFSDGDPVYLGATAGTITNVKPYAPNHLVYLGVVTTASNGSAGRMYVRVQNGYELDELHNVQARTPSLKDTLWYDNTVSPAQWKTASIATILGYTPANDADVVHKTGNETIAGDKDFTSRVQAEGGFWYTLSGVYKGQIVNISDDTFYNVNSGRTHYFGMGNGVGIANVPNNLSVPNGTFSILLQTADTIASFDANKNIVSLPLATYPSLTELSYVKGVTSAIQAQIDAVNVNVITITTAVSITTDTTSGSYGQHGRHVKISNGANVINIQCVSTSNADFVASYTKIGTSAITFVADLGTTLTVMGGGLAILNGAVGSTALLVRNGNTYYLQLNNY